MHHRPHEYASIARHLRIMSVSVKRRADELDLIHSPFPFSTDMFPPHWETRRERRLEEDECAAILGVVSSMKEPAAMFWPLLVGLALETGARLQELILAEWDEFNVAKRSWSLPLAHTKSKKARSIPLSLEAVDIMKKLEELAKPGCPRVFHHWSSPEAASNAFRKLVARSGVKNFHFHDLRHEAISRMVLHKRKLSIFEIMAIVGHSDIKMLHRYSNLRAEELAHRMD
jgi:integrase